MIVRQAADVLQSDARRVPLTRNLHSQIPVSPRNRGEAKSQTILIDMSGRPSSLHRSTSPFTTAPTFSGVPE